PRLEAFGLVLPEAMASGLPVVATRVGGIPDIVRDGETGLLVPPDSPGQLAEALARLVRARDLRERMAERARQIVVLEYDAELCARRHCRLYEDVLAGRQPQGVDQESACWAPAPALGSLPVEAPKDRLRPFASANSGSAP